MREPIYATTEGGLEYRCSFKLSGYALVKVGEHLTRHQVKKMVGDLDYSLIRTPITPLTDKEKNYILHDALVVLAYIKEEMEDTEGLLLTMMSGSGPTVIGFYRNGDDAHKAALGFRKAGYTVVTAEKV